MKNLLLSLALASAAVFAAAPSASAAEVNVSCGHMCVGLGCITPDDCSTCIDVAVLGAPLLHYC